MSYRFNDVLVKENQGKTQLVAEEFPKCMKNVVKASDKALRKLVCQINNDEIDINGDIDRLSNIAVSKLIKLIDEHKENKPSILIVKSGTMRIDDTTTQVIGILHRNGKEVTEKQTKSEYEDFFVKHNMA